MNIVQTLQNRLQELLTQVVEHLPALGITVTVVLLTWIVARLTDRFLHRILDRAEPRRSLRVFFRKITGIGIWTTGILVAAVVAFPSVTPGRLLSAMGLGSIALGFAFKDIFENFIAGMLVLLREPFRLGDYVECEGITGEVLEITVRDTRLLTVTGEQVILPNAMLFKNPVNVQTSAERRRIRAVCGVAYGEDADAARSVIERAVSACDSVERDKPVQVFINEFADSSVNFELAWWTGSDPLTERQSRDEVLSRVKRALDEAGIEIPFPYRTLTFPEPLRLANVDGEGG